MSKKFFLTAFALTLLLAGCGEAVTPDADTVTSTNPKEEVVVCQQDAKICPDGSSVGRIAPNCDFAACAANISTMITNKIALKDLPTDDCEAAGSNLQTSCPVAGDVVAKITTSEGDIWLKLFPTLVPKTIENFVGLSERGYYNGLIFHRVIPSFMIQGGDPTGTGAGGESIWGNDFADEFTDKLSNIAGSIAMANRGPNTNGSQFFINEADNTFLDFNKPPLTSQHDVFGQVISGYKNVEAITKVKRDAADKPLQDVKMEKVEVFKVQ